MFGDVPLVLIDNDQGLAEAVQAMRELPAIAVDLEADSFHHFKEKVCLIQVSIPGTDYVIDTLAVSDLAPLAGLLQDPDRVKVLHGADYDVVSLKRDYDISLRGLFDTMIAAQFLNLPRLGLADLLNSHFGVEIDKKYQRHDWARRPLLPEHLEYARGDTHWLLGMREVMQYRLERAGWSEAVAEECRLLEAREWQGRTPDPGDFLRIKGANALDEASLRVLRCLYEYREQQAEAMDRPVFKVIPDKVLLAVARRKPSDLDMLGELIRKSSGLMRQHGKALVQAVEQGRDDAREIPKAPSRKVKAGRQSPANAAVVERLKAWRAQRVERDELPPAIIGANAQLRELARVLPQDLEQLAAVPDLRAWQVQRYGAELLEVIGDGVEASKPRSRSSKRRRRRRKPPSGAD
jgi:ribonuclease D